MKVNGFCIKTFLTGALLCAVLTACSSGPAPAPADRPDTSQAASQTVDLDAAVRETSNYLNEQLPQGNKLVILNIQSEFPALSEYIIDELIANTVNDRVFSVVDRQQLDAIRAELNFNMSEEVSVESAQNIGQMLGAQIIVSGAVSRIGDLYRLRVRALSVQTAEIKGQFNRNIPEGPTVAALVQSRATGYGSAVVANRAGSGLSTSAAVITPAQAPAPEPAAPTTYKIGDAGPAGGLVFYDKGVVTNGWRYLEAAPNDIGPAQWGAGNGVSGTSTAVGTGKANTQRIVPVLEQAGEDGAALLCTAVNINGYADWFLPSTDELDLMYKNLKQKALGGFGSGWYWSSSQSQSYLNVALVQRFSDGTQESHHNKSNTYSVRAIRQF
jgi:hypothetical protein